MTDNEYKYIYNNFYERYALKIKCVSTKNPLDFNEVIDELYSSKKKPYGNKNEKSFKT